MQYSRTISGGQAVDPMHIGHLHDLRLRALRRPPHHPTVHPVLWRLCVISSLMGKRHGWVEQGTDLIDLRRLLERVIFGMDSWRPRRLLWPPNSLGGQIWPQIWNQWPWLPIYPCAYCLYWTLWQPRRLLQPLRLSKGSVQYKQYAHGYVGNRGHWFQIWGQICPPVWRY